MESINLAITSIIVFFFVLLGVKEFFSTKTKNKICVICLSITLTWISLLISLYFNFFSDKTILAILMGQTTLGIFYLLESKVKEKLKIFRLPFLLSLILIAYSLIELVFIIKAFSIILILWGVFICIYLFQNNKKTNSFVNKLIECCKKW